MKLGIIIPQSETEPVFNAVRLGTFALKAGDTSAVFPNGKNAETFRVEEK